MPSSLCICPGNTDTVLKDKELCSTGEGVIKVLCSLVACRNDVLATAGATQGLHTIIHLLFSPGDIVFVENTTYFMATTILKEDGELNVKPSE
jgi:DNA-binding transcriptional MocR family regulator